MKLRLESAPLTAEDQLALDAMLVRILRGKTMRSYMGYFLLMKIADRRDADLMLAAQTEPLVQLLDDYAGGALVRGGPRKVHFA